ncbi:energy transducer TonB [Magnetospirillum sp. SS-4]|uniref:energy transducer TonB n=1 Tax=Magnetospirillum sp. SS-4 TaxID=2681465 RepID=UPI001383C74B|nr:energy transducer TonB [Magnetospirillum sp. SS-4]CAA7612514.1 putative Protein TonB [Magnetospirillum sp. SS-4]
MRSALPVSATLHAVILTGLVFFAMPPARLPPSPPVPLQVMLSPLSLGPKGGGAATPKAQDIPPPATVLPAPQPPKPVEKPVVRSRAAAARPVPAPKAEPRPEPAPQPAEQPTPQREAAPAAESVAATPPAAAGPAASNSGAGGQPGVLRVDAAMLANKQNSAYLGTLFSWLEKHRQYPRRARLTNTEGVVLLKFRIDRTGKLQAWSVVKGSGSPLLDKAVTDMIAAADPLPPVPAGFAGDRGGQDLEFVIPVQFKLRS